ncbi:hypothetical protein [Hymenobacter sp. HDW8]|uniref:hypothetical protein n=1 Tax=Hymenobacter sp. HDW8 TaxID=2714932 RepID=UPI00140D163A|nr:hypothetical protein [Hymenobacter sp. HDW8]QIL75416.1 hypothetical protein G7064_05810 [Hymenobacter sp. HDW8]
MKLLILMLSLTICFSNCSQRKEYIHENGILVLDSARNHGSFDYFIPCVINDTLNLWENLNNIKAPIARRVNPNIYQFDIIESAWISTADSFYIFDKINNAPRRYITAVQLTLEENENFKEDSDLVERVDTVRLAGILNIDKFYNKYYHIVKVKKFILSNVTEDKTRENMH